MLYFFHSHIIALVRRNFIYRKRKWISSIIEFIFPSLAIFILIAIKLGLEDTENFKPKYIEPTLPTYKDVIQPLSFRDYLTAIRSPKVCVSNFYNEEVLSYVNYSTTEGNLNQRHLQWNEKNYTSSMDHPQRKLVKGIKYFISGIDVLNWPVPLVKCDARQCQVEGENATKFCSYNTLAIAPQNSDNKDDNMAVLDFKNYIYSEYPELNNIERQIGYPIIQTFRESNDIDNYVMDKSYDTSGKSKIALAVLLGLKNKSFQYTIRTNSTNFNSPELSARPVMLTQPSTSYLFSRYAKTPQDACPLEGGTAYIGTYQNLCTGLYIYNGGLIIQRLVNDWIMYNTGAKVKGYYVNEYGVSFTNFPSEGYIKEGFYGQIEDYASLLLVVGLLYPVASTIRGLVSEKENKSKELMKMMSISESSIGCAWFITIYMFFFLSGILCTILSSLLYPIAQAFILFIFWESTFLAITMFTFLISSISTKTTRATLVGLLLFFVGYFLTLAANYKSGDTHIISLVSLHPMTSFSYGIQLIGSLEDSSVGIDFKTWNVTDHPSGYTLKKCIFSLWFDSILWGVFSWYFNRALKGDFGAPEPWYFLFRRSYWFGKHNTTKQWNVVDENYSNIPYEPVSNALKEQEKNGKAVLIRGISKIFDEKIVLDNLDLSMYSGQIFSLLGHNGAGKTTVIGILTGMITPTSGYSSVAGKNIQTEMLFIRKNIGVCLQYDCFFPELTVKEHLQFYAAIKGVYENKTCQEAEKTILESMKDVALLDKQHTYSKNLSGGMKRKLSVAIAFIGDPSVVFLDEPTSGMDPFSRRFTWNVIRQYKENRCIILTTHFMEEADLLGDRIGIMSGGQLCCVGSPLFLKKSFGVGYQLTVIKKFDSLSNESNVSDKNIDDELNNIVTGSVRGANLLSNIGTELSFQLPIGASDTFPKMFDYLDTKEQSNQIEAYGVSITTLESVFLMVARGETGPEYQRCKLVSSNLIIENNNQMDGMMTELYNNYQQDLTEYDFFKIHMKSLLVKRAINFKRDKKAWVCSTILPIFFAFFGFVIFTYLVRERNLPLLKLRKSDYVNGNNVEIMPIPFNNANTFRCQPGTCIYHTPDISLENNTASYFYCGQQGHLSDNVQCSITNAINISRHFNGLPISQNVSTILDASKALRMNHLFGLNSTQYGALYITHDSESKINGGDYNKWIFQEAVKTECEQNNSTIMDTLDCSELGEGIGYVVSTNFTAQHSPFLYQAIADESIIREALNNDEYSLEATIHPLPITHQEKNYAQANDSFSAWFLLVLSFPIIIGSFANFVVQERMSKAKHLQTIAGVKPSAYWLSTYIWDILNYQLPMWIIFILMLIFNVESFITNSRGVLGGTIVILLLFGPSAAAFTYCISFLFKSPSSCSTFVVVFNFFIALVGPIVTFILRVVDVINKENGSDGSLFKIIAKYIEWVLRLIPSFNFSKGLFYMINIDSVSMLYGDNNLTVWNVDVLLLEVVIMLVQSIFYLVLAIAIDIFTTKPKAMQRLNSLLSSSCFFQQSSKSNNIEKFSYVEDEDVLRENERVLCNEVNDDIIVLKKLTKRYPNGKLAIDHLSLGIPPGQCFGLLGINGAGKTTTMSILTAEFPPSEGDAILAGYSVSSHPEKTRRRIGYCPQFDAHFTNMTGREHVELYASIKGLPDKCINDAVTNMLSLVRLSNEDSNRLSSKYSGGMKRKLSVCCAMIGNPQIVFLDEPSTGMDPVARRDLWKVISSIVTGYGTQQSGRTSVILTTHSMEECEALCPRIGIMASGKFRCIGSAQHLKSRFGKGYQIELKISEVSEDDGDYKEIISDFFKNQALTLNKTFDVEKGTNIADKIFLNVSCVKHNLELFSGDNYLSSKVNEDDPVGYTVFKNASLDSDVNLGEVAVFCVREMRVKRVLQFFEDTYNGSILRERQENKLRFEVSSVGINISSLFSHFEQHKKYLKLDNYGISQTSLEQVFNMYAVESEEAKLGITD